MIFDLAQFETYKIKDLDRILQDDFSLAIEMIEKSGGKKLNPQEIDGVRNLICSLEMSENKYL